MQMTWQIVVSTLPIEEEYIKISKCFTTWPKLDSKFMIRLREAQFSFALRLFTNYNLISDFLNQIDC